MDAEEPIAGFRVWRYSEAKVWDNGSGLRSTGMEYFWTPGINTARCLAGSGIGGWHPLGGKHAPGHTSPEDKCQCGFYAYDSLATAQYHARTQLAYEQVIVGAVLLWGEVMAGRVRDTRQALENPGLRFRAQYARIIALCENPDDERVLKGAEQMGVPVVPEKSIELYAREHGHQMRSE